MNNSFDFGFGTGDFDESAYWTEPDVILAEMVGTLVNVLGMPIGITLFTNGMILSGVLVSEREYLEALSHMFRRMTYTDMKSTDLDEAEAEAEAYDLFDFTVFAESTLPRFTNKEASPANPQVFVDFEDERHHDDDAYDGDDGDDDADLDGEPTGLDLVRHLHIKDVLILNPLPSLSFSRSPLPILRLRLTQIDGWMIGQATDQPPLDEDQNGNGTFLH